LQKTDINGLEKKRPVEFQLLRKEKNFCNTQIGILPMD
jgi:hypothetical protein